MRVKDANGEKSIYIKGKYSRLLDRIEELRDNNVSIERDEQNGLILIKNERTVIEISKNSIQLKAYGIRFRLKSSLELLKNIDNDKRIIGDIIIIINKELANIDEIIINDSGKLWSIFLSNFAEKSIT